MNKFSWVFLAAVVGFLGSGVTWAAEQDLEPVTLSIVAANPSQDKVQTIPIRIDLPQEVTPADVLDSGEMTLEYDDERRIYFVHKEQVNLKPKEVRVYSVKIRDLWFIPQRKLDDLKKYTETLLGRLKKSEYYESAKGLSKSILERLETIAQIQRDETLSRKSRIGAYRRNLQTLDEIQQDFARMEKLLTFTGGPPIPAMLEESPLKSDAPSTTTTWLVIFLIVIFVGLLGGQFFFTWQRRTHHESGDLSVFKEKLPGKQGPPPPKGMAA